ncbi:MAG: hypothetical protein BWY72_00473 [Bacteroidetes bacterium ADurb.Bin416]|nr:MAG: hypothetical protein BWY72_00473 [Bacteroidetes bacterium ADurb.Bin416]
MALLASGIAGSRLEKYYDDQTLEQAEKLRGIGIQEYCEQICAMQLPRFRRDASAWLAAAFSTASLPGILSNVANKMLLEGYNYIEDSWRKVCKIASVNDFKEHSRYRMTGSFKFEQVGPDGELKHGKIDEQKYGQKADTHGIMFALTRQMIINDDLAAFTDVPRQIGMGAAEAFHDTLTTLVAKYPKSDLIPVVNAMLALWDSGKRPVPSSGYVSLFGLENLLTEGDQNSQDSLLLKLTYTPEEPHTLVMAYPTDSVNGNRLQFDVALYNFTTFLIKDYELSLAKVGQMNVLLVQGFENAADVLRYRAWINFQNQAPTDKYPGLRLIPISNNNLPLLEQGLDPSLYWSFFLDHYTPSEPLIP